MRASRNRTDSTRNGSCGFRFGDWGLGEVGGASSPATNMTGASCASSSGGYEFMVIDYMSSLASEVNEGMRRMCNHAKQLRDVSKLLLVRFWFADSVGPSPR